MVIMLERTGIDRAGKLQRLFKPAVGYLHLLIAESFLHQRVAAATPDPQRCLINFNFQLVGTNTCQIYFDDPTLGAVIHVRGWVP